MTLKAALMGYGVASAAIVGAGIWLPIIGVELARVMGWSHSFVGTLFVAFASSVPELRPPWGPTPLRRPGPTPPLVKISHSCGRRGPGVLKGLPATPLPCARRDDRRE